MQISSEWFMILFRPCSLDRKGFSIESVWFRRSAVRIKISVQIACAREVRTEALTD